MLLLLSASVLPVILILIFFYYRDKYEKEPIGMLVRAFIGGILAVLSTLAIIHVLNLKDVEFTSKFNLSLYQAFVLAAIPEEVSKFFFLYVLIWKNRNFNDYFDGIIYAVFVSLGFGCIENILYVIEHGLTVALLRALTAVPAHALFGVCMGYYFALAKFDTKKTDENLLKSLFYAIFLHGVYDFLLFYAVSIAEDAVITSIIFMFAFYWFVFKLYRLGFRKIKILSEQSFFKPENE